MNTKKIAIPSLVLSTLLAAAGCGSAPPQELKNARTAYQQAVQAPGAGLAQTQIYEARKSLDRAEKSFDEHGDDAATRDLSYVAIRKAQVANASASALASMERTRVAQAQMNQIRQQQAMANAQQLEHTKDALDRSQQTVMAERQARAAADKRAKDALATIEGMKAQEEERGLVLTLGSGLMFGSGKSQLMPAATHRLSKIAEVLRNDTRPVRIIGHTDSTGSDALNDKLSKDRAKSVGKYLIAQGVPEDRVTMEGVASSQPLAGNDSAEGRATNRRVEIILSGNVDESAMPKEKKNMP